MKHDFLLTASTPDGHAFLGRASRLTLKGMQGEITILSHHAPLICPVLAGRCRMTLENGEEIAAEMSEGILSVKGDDVTLLCQSFVISN